MSYSRHSMLGLPLALLLACGGGQNAREPWREAAPGPGPSKDAGSQPVAENPAKPDVSDESPAAADVKKVNEPGQPVDIEPILVPGKVTVVEFYAEWCKPCREIERRVLAVMDTGAAVALRKIDIGEDGETPVAKQHEVNTVPSVRIYDREGKLRYSLEGQKSNQAAEIAGQLAR